MTMNNSTKFGNFSVLNVNSKTQGVFKGTSVVLSLVVFMAGLTLFLCNTFTCVAMSRTKRVPYATRILTCITLVSDAISSLMFVFGTIAAFFELDAGPVITCFVSEIGRLCMAVSYVSISVMSVERVICLNFGNYYSKHFNNKAVRRMITAVIVTVVSLKLSTRYVILPLVNNTGFNFVELSRDLQINLCILGLSLIVSIVCYVNIYVIIRHHSRRMTAVHVQGAVTKAQIVSRSYYSTRAISVVFAFFIFIHLPILITLSVYHFKANDSVGRFLVLASQIIMSVANPLLYAWRFKECRYMIKSFIHQRFGLFANSVSAMRIDIYNIVINEGPSRAEGRDLNTNSYVHDNSKAS